VNKLRTTQERTLVDMILSSMIKASVWHQADALSYIILCPVVVCSKLYGLLLFLLQPLPHLAFGAAGVHAAWMQFDRAWRSPAKDALHTTRAAVQTNGYSFQVWTDKLLSPCQCA